MPACLLLSYCCFYYYHVDYSQPCGPVDGTVAAFVLAALLVLSFVGVRENQQSFGVVACVCD